MKSKRFSLFSTSIAASLVLAAPSARAAITWDAGGGDNNWSTTANWSSNASPAAEDVTLIATKPLAATKLFVRVAAQ